MYLTEDENIVIMTLILALEIMKLRRVTSMYYYAREIFLVLSTRILKWISLTVWKQFFTRLGFSSGEKTWLPVNESYKEGVNVEDQQIKENSVLSTYKDLIKFRKKFKSAILMGTCDVQEKVFH